MIGLDKYTPAQREKFVEAFSKELKGLADIGTFGIVPDDNHKGAIPLKNVYKVKYDASGNLVKYKVRTTLLGYRAKGTISSRPSHLLVV